MLKVGIVVDSSSCFPKELSDKYGVMVAPHRVVIGKKDYRDQMDIGPDEFWDIFQKSGGALTTNPSNPGDFLDIFRKLANSTDSIVCVVLSQKLSATYASALQAKDLAVAERPDLKIEVIDSRSSIGGLGFIALEGARIAEAGGNFAEVIAGASKIIPRVRYLLVLETAKYILRIGRAPEEAKKIADQANFNPIMGIVKDTGLVDMLGRELSMAAAQSKAVDMIKDYADVKKPLHVMLHYSRNRKEVDEMEKAISAKYGIQELYTSQFSPVVVTALGPSVGLAFYS